MIKKTVKCDICNKEFELKNEIEDNHILYMVPKRYDSEGNHIPDEDRRDDEKELDMDLCPDCYRALRNALVNKQIILKEVKNAL